jgi:hypothetical protein
MTTKSSISVWAERGVCRAQEASIRHEVRITGFKFVIAWTPASAQAHALVRQPCRNVETLIATGRVSSLQCDETRALRRFSLRSGCS